MLGQVNLTATVDLVDLASCQAALRRRTPAVVGTFDLAPWGQGWTWRTNQCSSTNSALRTYSHWFSQLKSVSSNFSSHCERTVKACRTSAQPQFHSRLSGVDSIFFICERFTSHSWYDSFSGEVVPIQIEGKRHAGEVAWLWHMCILVGHTTRIWRL